MGASSEGKPAQRPTVEEFLVETRLWADWKRGGGEEEKNRTSLISRRGGASVLAAAVNFWGEKSSMRTGRFAVPYGKSASKTLRLGAFHGQNPL